MHDSNVGTCPMCESSFDQRKFKLIECSECGAEGSTACCLPIVNGNDSPVCSVCEDAE